MRRFVVPPQARVAAAGGRRRMQATPPPPARVDLASGHPRDAELPRELLQEAVQWALRGQVDGGSEDTVYNYAHGVAGDPALLEHLSGFLTERYNCVDAHSSGCAVGVAPDNLMLAAGSSQALDICCTQLDLVARHRAGDAAAGAALGPGAPFKTNQRPTPRSRSTPGVVFVESPCYMLALHTFRKRGWVCVDIASESDGNGNRSIDLVDLEAKLEAHGVPVLLYTTPTHHNPTGWVMPKAKREALLEVAAAWGLYVVADEVYQFMTFPEGAGGGRSSEPAPPAFGALIAAGHTGARDYAISLGSVSKILSPGLRVGWVHAGSGVMASIIRESGAAMSGGGYTGVNGHVAVRALCDARFLGVLEGVLVGYAQRCAALLSAIDDFLKPLGVEYTRPHGGYFVWCTLPEGATSEALDAALGGSVAFKHGRDFYADAGRGARELRLCFVPSQPAAMREGVERMAAALRALLKKTVNTDISSS